jgi:hypothetical protein
VTNEDRRLKRLLRKVRNVQQALEGLESTVAKEQWPEFEHVPNKAFYRLSDWERSVLKRLSPEVRDSEVAK